MGTKWFSNSIPTPRAMALRMAVPVKTSHEISKAWEHILRNPLIRLVFVAFAAYFVALFDI